MKHVLASISYLIFIILFGMQLVLNSTFATRYVVFIIALYFLFLNIISDRAASTVKTYGFIYSGAIIIYLVFSLLFVGQLENLLLVVFFLASVLGYLIAARTPLRSVAKQVPQVIEKPSKPKLSDDLTKIEGIGPEIKKLLAKKDIRTFKQLSETRVPVLRTILKEGGDRFTIHTPTTWPRQARLAAVGKWTELGKLQEKLDGGRTTPRKSVKKSTRKTAKKVAKKSAKNTTKKVVKKAATRTTKKSTKRSPVKKATKRVAKKFTRKSTSKKSAKRASKKTTKKSPGRPRASKK